MLRNVHSWEDLEKLASADWINMSLKELKTLYQNHCRSFPWPILEQIVETVKREVDAQNPEFLERVSKINKNPKDLDFRRRKRVKVCLPCEVGVSNESKFNVPKYKDSIYEEQNGRSSKVEFESRRTFLKNSEDGTLAEVDEYGNIINVYCDPNGLIPAEESNTLKCFPQINDKAYQEGNLDEMFIEKEF